MERAMGKTTFDVQTEIDHLLAKPKKARITPHDITAMTMKTILVLYFLFFSFWTLSSATRHERKYEGTKGDIRIITKNSSNLLNKTDIKNTTMETFEINLDLPPELRWKEVMASRKDDFLKVVDWIVENTIPQDILPKLEAAFDLVEHYWPSPEYRRELEGIAEAVNISVGMLLVFNLNYEFNAGCTSIVAQSSDGTIWHGRNLDYSIPGLQEIAIHVKFHRNNGIVFEGTTYAGYVGMLTGMKHGAFALSMDQRETGTPIWENLIEFLVTRGAATASPFFYRDIFQYSKRYEAALELLQTAPMIAPAYLILSGAKPNQGAVVARDRNTAVDTWTLSASEWFLVETNDDRWKPPEDGRRDAANRNMRKLNPETISGDSMMDVMNQWPTNNELTTYSAVMNAGQDYYASMLQHTNHSQFNSTAPSTAAREYPEPQEKIE